MIELRSVNLEGPELLFNISGAPSDSALSDGLIETSYDRVSMLIKDLRELDEVTLILQDGQSKKLSKLETGKVVYKTQPFSYQLEGIEYGLTKHDSWLLLDAPGLGKTLQLTYLAE